MLKPKYRFIIFPAIFLFALSGCANVKSGSGDYGNNGGVYKSEKNGDTWAQKTLIPTTIGQPRTFSSINIFTLAMDPSDENAIYAGGVDSGLFFTYNGGDDWFPATSLDKVTVRAVAVDPKNKCVIYIAAGNKIMKSADCCRSWKNIFFDNDPNELVTAIAVDFYNSNNIYAGLARGDVIKSVNQGENWSPAVRFESAVVKIAISPGDSRVIFVGTKSDGAHRSSDGGVYWNDLSDNINKAQKSFSLEFRDLAMTKAEPGLVILASKYGLLKSSDNGDNWKNIELLTPEKDAIINSVAIGPTDAKYVYYVTNTTFYRSTDAGASWATKKMPTAKAGTSILIDPVSPNIIYLGAGRARM